MEDKKILLDNIAKIHTTEMGVDRIKRNLKIDTVDVVEYCKNKMLDKNCNIYKQGKNWYCEVENIKITINSYSYTIITAHKPEVTTVLIGASKPEQILSNLKAAEKQRTTEMEAEELALIEKAVNLYHASVI